MNKELCIKVGKKSKTAHILFTVFHCLFHENKNYCNRNTRLKARLGMPLYHVYSFVCITGNIK